jgi:hypothetical protein
MLARNLRNIPSLIVSGRSTVLVRDASSKNRRGRQQIRNIAKPTQNQRRPIARVLPVSRDKSVAQLEAENAELRRRVTELVLEIEASREG